VLFSVPVLWLSRQPGFRIEHVWTISVATVALQALMSFALVQREMKRRLAPTVVPASA
jgi:hypothetical protein